MPAYGGGNHLLASLAQASATDTVDGEKHQKVKLEFGPAGVAKLVTEAVPLPTKSFGLGTLLQEILAVVNQLYFLQ